ncbi:MAG TPA: glycoside hydrolase [Chthoniobacterales bacterium]|jgi:hypothetical protein
MKTLFNPSSSGSNTLFVRHLACLLLLLGSAGAYATSIQNNVLKVTLDPTTAEIRARDLVTTHLWSQALPAPTNPYTATGISATTYEIDATITGGSEGDYTIAITLDSSDLNKKEFHLSVTPPGPDPMDQYNYVYLPPYPFIYTGTNTTDTWYYVQNNGGEGTLMPIGDTSIRALGGWTGSQPWWGVTNLTEAMMARLGSFVRIQPNAPTDTSDISAYQIPIEIQYSFYDTGGYVGLAKAYRDYFINNIAAPQKLADKADGDARFSFLQDGTYAYFWDDTGDDFDDLLTEMETAGLDRVIAMLNVKDREDEVTTSESQSIADHGWLSGLYRQPTPNLDHICSSINNWVVKLLTGEKTEADLAYPVSHNWDSLYTPDIVDQWTNGNTLTDPGLPYFTTKWGADINVIYHDTLPQQTAPVILDPPGLQSIQEEQAGRLDVLDETHSYTDTAHANGFVSGSGEGVSAWWTIPHLDYWEGGMEESTYGDINRSPITQHADGAGEFVDDCYPLTSPCSSEDPDSWSTQEAACLDEQHRIPLLALQWHDYVAETWNWRNSTFVVSSLSWKKDLFNILYGGMPMWHVNADLWAAHSAEYIASYFKLLPVRRANGSAEMIDHHWVNDDPAEEVQYTDWDSGKRVIVNFSGEDIVYTDTDGFVNYASANVPAYGYAMLPDPVSENCNGTGTPTGWTNTGTGVNWDRTSNPPPLEGTQSLFISGSGVGGNSTKVDFGDQAEVWVFFKLAVTGSAPATAATIAGLSANGGTITELLQVTPFGKLSFGGAQTSASLTLNTTNNVWLHYRKGTGSNGIVEVAFSTSETKPTSGSTYYAASTSYTGTNEAGRLFLGTTASTTINMVFDKIRVDNSEIRSNPL